MNIELQLELEELFWRNFPHVVREERLTKRILWSVQNQVIPRRNAQGKLIGTAVINENVILLLCVDEAYRRQGIGSELLREAEDVIRQAGHSEVVVGVGFNYLTPGVPTSKRYAPAVNESLDPSLDDSASSFFEKRGYRHAWEGNCFDMRLPLSEYVAEHHIGDTIDGVTYRWATGMDVGAVCACADDAYPDFRSYYSDSWIYSSGAERVLAAFRGDEAVGAVMISIAEDNATTGGIGCTMVRKAYRGHHIALNLMKLATAFLKECGMTDAFLGYTYSGLDYLYGQAGYKICTYYMMAKKKL